MENRIYLMALFDIYKDLLTLVEQDTFNNYYMEDLSLTEIAENRNISKSSVSKTLNQVISKLKNYEEVLKIYEIKNKLNDILFFDNLEEVKKEIKKLLK